MYIIHIVGIGVVIGILLVWGLERYDTREYRKNFKRNLKELEKQ